MVEGLRGCWDGKVEDMISVSAAENHRFGRVKKNGYDPAEVDAVVARLIESLHAYEERTDKLEERLAEADASADAIRRTFIVAESTRDEILAEAAQEAEKTITRAKSEVADLQDLAEKLEIEIAGERERGLADANAEADRLILDAEQDAARRGTAAEEEIEALRADALSAAANAADDARAIRASATAETARIRQSAQDEARAIVEDAEERAAVVSHASEREGEALRTKVASMRAAVAALQHAATDLATLTTEEGKVIDLKAIEALGSTPQAVPETLDDEPEPEALMSVAEAREEIEREEEHEETVVEDEPRTYYQRTTGTPLSERIKIARTPG